MSIDIAGIIIGVFSLLLGSTSIGLAVWIMRQQNYQIEKQKAQLTTIVGIGGETKRLGEETKKLGEEAKSIGEETKKIGIDTHHTAVQLRFDNFKKEVIRDFFCQANENHKSYKCVFPVLYNKRPLPYIVVGDYNALHVIQSMIGVESLELIQVTNSIEVREKIGGNVIYLCTPQANPALRLIAPPLSLPAQCAPKFDTLEIPCWFANDGNQKSIYIWDGGEQLTSPAEKAYLSANLLEGGEPYFHPSPSTKDYAILLRLTIDSKKIFVVAGIHQYGTWIGGDFFRLLTRGEFSEYSDIFRSDKDFLAVLWGEYNYKSFTVSSCGIHHDYFWEKDVDVWKKVKTHPNQRVKLTDATAPFSEPMSV